ncbi:MAG TPA: DUF1801 domain-containing protein [Candidatus Micrarchaeaceae archaeon]|nr:DUF1801 domain-containing protein [Candidatus Micrarchaeaceae archaeon]
MAERKPTKKVTEKFVPRASVTGTASKGFSAEERAAMKERVKEQKRAADKALGESDALAKIAEMTGLDRALGKRLHAIIKASAPGISATTWYGMPAYTKDGKVVCHFKTAKKFNTRYATIGFSDAANLDEGTMWPVEFAVTELTAADEARVAALVKKAVG